jgi:predicted nucleic acid-binding protein
LIRVALDSNFLIYAAGIERNASDAAKVNASKHLLGRLPQVAEIAISTQALGETYNVALKAGYGRDVAQVIVERYSERLELHAPNLEAFERAVGLATAHRLQIWDSLILASADTAHCSVLLSEDMQDGFAWRGVSVLNPFGDRTERLLFG